MIRVNVQNREQSDTCQLSAKLPCMHQTNMSGLKVGMMFIEMSLYPFKVDLHVLLIQHF